MLHIIFANTLLKKYIICYEQGTKRHIKEKNMRPKELDCLFEPITVGSMRLKNRLVMAPMGTGYASEDGYVTPKLMDYLVARAKGGAGLITVEVAFVHELGKAGVDGELGIDDDKYIPELKKLADAIHNAGAKVVIQLNHAGRYARKKNLGQTPVAPSAIASRYTGETPRELSTSEVEDIVTAFAKGAKRAKEAGFDGVELMGSTGYLISQFCSAITNKRKDKYGGSTPEKRAFFVKQIIEEIRKKTGNDFSLCVKMSVNEYLPGGNTVADSQIMAKIFADAGADRLHAWAGWHESPKPMLPMSVPRAAFAHLAKAIKAVTDVPVTAVGRINDPFVAAELIRDGKADLIAIGRGLLADPDFANKAFFGKTDEIRNCIGCCHCFDTVMSQIHKFGDQELSCAINAEFGREGENLFEKAKSGKSVLVVGGGPGGMEAARVASKKGHKVTLWEKSCQLGGSLIPAAIPPFKEEINCLTSYLIKQMEVNSVNVMLDKKATAEEILNLNPDHIIIASGAKPSLPEIPGIEKANVVMAVDLLSQKVTSGQNVAVIGGGMIGIDIAEYLYNKGKQVTLLTRQKRIGADIGISVRWVVMKRIKKSSIKIITNISYKMITKEGVIIDKNGDEMLICADTIAVSGGLAANNGLADSLRCKITLTEIGDCISPRKINEAIHEGFDAALKI